MKIETCKVESISLSLEGENVGSIGALTPTENNKIFHCSRFMLYDRSIADMFAKQDNFSIIVTVKENGLRKIVQKDKFRILDHSFIYTNSDDKVSIADEVKIENIDGAVFDDEKYIRYLENKFSW